MPIAETITLTSFTSTTGLLSFQRTKILVIVWRMWCCNTSWIEGIFRATTVPILKNLSWFRCIHGPPCVHTFKLPLCFPSEVCSMVTACTRVVLQWVKLFFAIPTCLQSGLWQICMGTASYGSGYCLGERLCPCSMAPIPTLPWRNGYNGWVESRWKTWNTEVVGIGGCHCHVPVSLNGKRASGFVYIHLFFGRFVYKHHIYPMYVDINV